MTVGCVSRRKGRLKKYQGSFSDGFASIDVLENEHIRGLDVGNDDRVALPDSQESVGLYAIMRESAFALLADALGDDERAEQLCPAFVGVITAMSEQNAHWVISESTVRGMAAFLERVPTVHATGG